MISIITAVYNRKDTIADSIESLLEQNVKDFELIVIDAESSDGTLDVLNGYSDVIACLVSERDAGIYDALNKGVLKAKGDVIGFLHSDDLFYDESVLQQVVDEFRRTEADAVYGDLIYVDRDNPNRIIRNWESGNFSLEKLSNGWMPPHPALFMKRSVYEKVGLYSLDYPIAADYDHILRSFRSGINVSYIPKTLVKMRVGGASNNSINNLIKKYKENYKIVKSHGFNGHRTTLMKMLGKIVQYRL